MQPARIQQLAPLSRFRVHILLRTFSPLPNPSRNLFHPPFTFPGSLPLLNAMTQPAAIAFLAKSPAAIRTDLAGFPPAAIEAALRFRESSSPGDFSALILAMIAFYRPGGASKPIESFPPETRFREELGLDSLTLTEMVFKLDELLGVAIEIREAAQIQTLAELQEFLRAKLWIWNEPAAGE